MQELEQEEWDAFIYCAIKPFIGHKKQDMLVSTDDLRQEAWIAVLEAQKKFDPTKCKFTTFAYNHIRWHLIRYLNKHLKDKPTQVDDIDIFSEPSYEQEFFDDSKKDIFEIIKDEPNASLLIDKFIHKKTLGEISAKNNIAYRTTAKRIRRLMHLIASKLKNENS